MTEFLPPEALVAKNEEQTMGMRIAAWSHRDHIKPIMVRMFASAAQYAMNLRAPLIDDIEATGIKKFYYQYAKLTDGRSVKLQDLLEFPLYSAKLPVTQSGLPDDQQLSREYSITLRVGGQQLRFGTDDSLDLSMQNIGWSGDGSWEGKHAYERVLRKDAVPETVKIIEKVDTGFGSIDNLHDSHRSKDSYVTTVDEYYLKTSSWIPNLSYFGRPDVELPKITDISFNYYSENENSRGHIDKYGTMSDNKIAVARRLARLTQIASQFLDLGAYSAEEAESIKAIASASQQPAL